MSKSKVTVTTPSLSQLVKKKEIERRVFECTNYLVQKLDSGESITSEEQKVFDYLMYIENGKQKPF